MASNKLEFGLVVDDKGSVKIKKFGKTLDKTKLKGVSFGKKMAAVGKGMGSIVKSAGLAAAAFSVLGIAIATAFAKMAISKGTEIFLDLERAISRLGNVGVDDIGAVGDQLRDMDKQLGTSTEMVNGYYQVMSAGVTAPKAAIDLLAESSKLAKESSIEQAEAVKGLASLYSAYQGDLESYADATDLLYRMEKSGITTVQELIPHVGSLGNLSKSAGLSAAEFAGGLAQVTRAGQGTNEAVTQFKSVLTGMMKPTKEMEELFKAYGGALGAIQALGFVGTLEAIQVATGGNAAAMSKLFGRKEAVLGMMQLMKGGFGQLRESVDDMATRTGASSDAWSRYTFTLSAHWEKFKNVVSGIVELIGETLSPAYKDMINLAVDWIEKNKELIELAVAEWFEGVVRWVEELDAGDVEKFATASMKAFNHLIGVLKNIAKWFANVGRAVAEFYNENEKTFNDLGVIISAFGVLVSLVMGLVADAIWFTSEKVIKPFAARFKAEFELIGNIMKWLSDTVLVKWVLKMIAGIKKVIAWILRLRRIWAGTGSSAGGGESPDTSSGGSGGSSDSLPGVGAPTTESSGGPVPSAKTTAASSAGVNVTINARYMHGNARELAKDIQRELTALNSRGVAV